MDAKSKLIRQIREDMPILVARLNDQRGLIGRIRGDKYEFKEEREMDGARFTIILGDRLSERRKQGRLIVGGIVVDENEENRRPLTIYNSVYSEDKYSLIKEYLHALAHDQGVRLDKRVLFNIS